MAKLWMKWLAWRARSGDPEALVSLGHLCETQTSVDASAEQGVAQANHFYRQAAEKGNAQAMWNLGVNLLGKKGGEADNEQAVAWLHKAADLDHPLALWALGKMHLAGRLVERNVEQGLALLTRAAQQGCEPACLALSDIHGKGMFGMPVDAQAAQHWYLRAQPFSERLWVRLGLKKVRPRGADRSAGSQ